MIHAHSDFDGAPGNLRAAIDAVCDSVAPTWPLDRFIAVSPYWAHRDQQFAAVSDWLPRVADSNLTMPSAFYRDAWNAGAIQPGHLRLALAEAGAPVSEAALIAALADADPVRSPLPLLSDVLDANRDLTHRPAWRDAITHQVSQFCGAYFDRDQADWHTPRRDGLYGAWLSAIIDDRSVALLMDAPAIRERARQLPRDAIASIAWAQGRLALPGGRFADLLQVALMRINGWAAWCAYLRWQARLAGTDDDHIIDLLAVRLAWECLVDDGSRAPASTWEQWHRHWPEAPDPLPEPHTGSNALWQRAQEIAFQAPLAQALARARAPCDRPAAAVQLAFCIDVRSEVFRRALELVSPTSETLGCAGFFGLPLDYTPIGSHGSRPQLPGLLAPKINATDSTGRSGTDRRIAQRRRVRLRRMASWEPFRRLPASAFTRVEALGVGYLGKLIRRSLPSDAPVVATDRLALTAAEAALLHPELDLPDANVSGGRVALARDVLRAMSLTERFARLVLLVGHGSQSANNPQAAGLDCGACCGQTGEVNARALAGLLNDPTVRAGLLGQAIRIPDTTHFMAGLHNTTTDDVVVFDQDRVPAGHRDDLARLLDALAAAGVKARAERAPGLGLAHLAARPEALATAIRRRANDWAQTRPEWGLADNAAFLVAPRWRSRGIDLKGRVFLHEYDHQRDVDGSVLELIMTAPMIVAHWINMQYYASTVDNLHFGSGNKQLHNVVGGRIGVFEGNGGDLRIGLARQSIHDGRRYVHTPLRLSVFIEAGQPAVDAVIARHATVRQLINNAWLHLFRIEPGGPAVYRYRRGLWEPWAFADGQATSHPPLQNTA